MLELPEAYVIWEKRARLMLCCYKSKSWYFEDAFESTVCATFDVLLYLGQLTVALNAGVEKTWAN